MRNTDFILLEYAARGKGFIAEMSAQTRENYYSPETRVPMKVLLDYYKTYRQIPSLDVACDYASAYPNAEQTKAILNEAYNSTATLTDGDFPFYLDKLKKQYNDFYIKERVSSMSQGLSGQYDLDNMNDYIKKTALEISVIKSNQVREQGELSDSAKQRLVRYREIKANPDMARGVFSGFKELDKITNGFRGSELILISGPTGCHAKGQAILMFDGSIKKVEDIVVGDQLMGPDSKPRNVLQLCRGVDDMYEVIPVKGKPFIVNGEHVLSLQRVRERSLGTKKTNNLADKIIDVKVIDYLSWSLNQKHLHKLFRRGVEFNNDNELPISPYFLGVSLGDGCLGKGSGGFSITTADEEIKNEVDSQAALFNSYTRADQKPNNKASSHFIYHTKGKRNPISIPFRELGLWKTDSSNKFIPEIYKTSSVKDRLEILAGLLDTDGSLDCNCYDYISKSLQLAEDVCFITRSLGMAAFMQKSWKTDQSGTGNWYYRVSISGNTERIPVRIPRKKASLRTQKKSVLRTGFKIRKLGYTDNYYGFTLDSDHRYLLDDFTVTHNSGKSVILMNIAVNAWLGTNRPTMSPDQWNDSGKNVWFITIENPKDMLERRIDACLAGVGSDHIRDGSLTPEEEPKFKQSLKFQHEYGALKKFYISDLGRGVSMAMVEAEYEKILSIFKPDIIIIDYLGIMKAVNPTGTDWLDQGSVAADMHEFCRNIKDAPVISASQMKSGMRTQNGVKRFTGDPESVARSKMITDNVNMNIQIKKDEDFHLSSYLELCVAKNRDGKTGDIIVLTKEFWKQTVCDPIDDFLVPPNLGHDDE